MSIRDGCGRRLGVRGRHRRDLDRRPAERVDIGTERADFGPRQRRSADGADRCIEAQFRRRRLHDHCDGRPGLHIGLGGDGPLRNRFEVDFESCQRNRRVHRRLLRQRQDDRPGDAVPDCGQQQRPGGDGTRAGTQRCARTGCRTSPGARANSASPRWPSRPRARRRRHRKPSCTAESPSTPAASRFRSPASRV